MFTFPLGVTTRRQSLVWVLLALSHQTNNLLVYSMQNRRLIQCMNNFLHKVIEKTTPITLSFEPIECRTACQRPGLVNILVVYKSFKFVNIMYIISTL